MHPTLQAPAGRALCPWCSKEVSAGNLGAHKATHNSDGWPACSFCEFRAAQKSSVACHEKVCGANANALAAPAHVATVPCPHPGCGRMIEIRSGKRRAEDISRHLRTHGIGECKRAR